MRILLILTLLAASAQAADDFAARRDDNWHQWRGPRADGMAPHGDPPVTWDEQTNIRWTVEVPGEGSATPIVWEDRLFLLAAVPTDRPAPGPAEATADAKTQPPPNIYQFVVLCLDRATGEERWRQVACEEAPHEGRHPTNTYASGSPTTDGQRLYAWFGSRGLFCYDLDGNLLWRRDLGRLRTRFGWGEGSSPVLAGDALVVNCDQEDQSFITVLDAATGEPRWRAERDEPTSWSTPLVVEHQGRQQAIVNATNRVRSYDLASGQVLWECGGQTVNAIPSPLVAGGAAICVSGYRGAAAYAIPLDAAGDLTDSDKILWSRHEATPYVPSPVAVGDRLYFTAGNQDILSCLNAATGEVIFERQRLAGLGNVYASPVAAAGRIYFTGRDGATVVIRDAAELDVLASNQLDDQIDASPAIAGGQLFLRGKRRLYCIAARPAEETGKSRSPTEAVERAVAYLAREVPRWHAENHCYSCHNNGDAARALYTASRRGFHFDPEALADTTAWLTEPARWEHNGGEGPFVDKQLAAIQFAAALATAIETQAVGDPSPLTSACDAVAAAQQADGSWTVDAQGTVGSPATYGRTLATVMAARVLAAADAERFAEAIGRADGWLRSRQPKTVLDAAATLLRLADSSDEEAAALRNGCLDLIGSGQNKSGGWGPFVTSAPEPFDTALVLLALSREGAGSLFQDRRQDRVLTAPEYAEPEKNSRPPSAAIQRMIERGRCCLIDCQCQDGSWIETTRPAGAESYAQRISTTAWATLALLAK